MVLIKRGKRGRREGREAGSGLVVRADRNQLTDLALESPYTPSGLPLVPFPTAAAVSCLCLPPTLPPITLSQTMAQNQSLEHRAGPTINVSPALKSTTATLFFATTNVEVSSCPVLGCATSRSTPSIYNVPFNASTVVLARAISSKNDRSEGKWYVCNKTDITDASFLPSPLHTTSPCC